MNVLTVKLLVREAAEVNLLLWSSVPTHAALVQKLSRQRCSQVDDPGDRDRSAPCVLAAAAFSAPSIFRFK